MLEEFMGLPAHPLLIHTAVVLVPLLAILAILYSFVPFVRPHTRWVLGLLALATPVAAFLAKLSGDAFFARLQSRDRVSAEYVPKLEAHQEFGTRTLYATLVLALLTLALVYFVGPRVRPRVEPRVEPQAASEHAAGGVGSSRALSLVLGVLVLVAAAASLYYVVRTGDSGAKAVWDGF